MGLANLVRPGTDEALARVAAKSNIPYALSTAASTRMERIIELAPSHTWFQLYVGRDPLITDDLVRRAKDAGISTLLVTVDIPAPGKRVRDLTNGLTVPLRPSLKGVIDLALHPRWLLQAIGGGTPRFESLEQYSPAGGGPMAHATYVAQHLSSGQLDWDTINRIRGLWPHHMVIKGILHPEDARRALKAGVNGIVVSNHGGRQLDAAPASIEVLPSIREAVGQHVSILLDSGIRSGDDIVRALAAGADFVLIGRPFLYGVAALGIEQGPGRAIQIFLDEMRNTLVHLGCRTVGDLDGSHLWQSPDGPVHQSRAVGGAHHLQK
jgi:L-lactate dehydrogenase (cytochrome)/(S)-mandelate dehydrogenase